METESQNLISWNSHNHQSRENVYPMFRKNKMALNVPGSDKDDTFKLLFGVRVYLFFITGI